LLLFAGIGVIEFTTRFIDSHRQRRHL
jgi:hypothetical protein